MIINFIVQAMLRFLFIVQFTNASLPRLPAMTALEVYPHMTLTMLQQHFTDHFPNLQLELVRSDGTPVAGSKTMDELAGYPTHCCFVIDGDMPVAELEANFRTCFGVAVRVNRWTGYAWHDTDEARQWTLDHHNRQAKKSRRHTLLQ